MKESSRVIHFIERPPGFERKKRMGTEMKDHLYGDESPNFLTDPRGGLKFQKDVPLLQERGSIKSIFVLSTLVAEGRQNIGRARRPEFPSVGGAQHRTYLF
jgi:hypothetical protein